MYPKDNVFQIYYNIGKRVPFQVKRSPTGCKGSYDEEYRYSQEGRTFMVERVEIHDRVYGTAYGYLMIDGVRDDNNQYMESYEKGTVPCAGCGGWVLIDVPGQDMNEIFPEHKPTNTKEKLLPRFMLQTPNMYYGSLKAIAISGLILMNSLELIQTPWTQRSRLRKMPIGFIPRPLPMIR